MSPQTDDNLDDTPLVQAIDNVFRAIRQREAAQLLCHRIELEPGAADRLATEACRALGGYSDAVGHNEDRMLSGPLFWLPEYI